MDLLKLSRIDEELDSSEAAALRFLCLDIVKRKRQEGIKDAKGLFLKLQEYNLMDDGVFLSELLHTIKRADLLSLLETDSRRIERTEGPILSEYRKMLYQIYDDMTEENLDKMRFLLTSKLGRRQIEACNTALDLFAEMEKADILSQTKLNELHSLLKEVDQQLAQMVQRYMDGPAQQDQRAARPVSIDSQRPNNVSEPTPSLPAPSISPVSEPWSRSVEEMVYSDAQPVDPPANRQPPPVYDETDYYILRHKPRGLCVVINNEKFLGHELQNRRGTQQDAKALQSVFERLGFTVVIHNDLPAARIQHELGEVGKGNFLAHDALVVCVLSHGEKECVFGTDEKKVTLRELKQPFTSGSAPTLAGKPKLFFIQACQGGSYQEGAVPCPPRPEEGDVDRQTPLEEDAGPVRGETVASDADFLVGMATVPECKSFRNTTTGSIYIQELCRQLLRSAESPQPDDVLTVLTRVNREVGKGEYLKHKQMPQPHYTLTKKLVLDFV